MAPADAGGPPVVLVISDDVDQALETLEARRNVPLNSL